MKKRFLRNIILIALAALCWCGQSGAVAVSADRTNAAVATAYIGSNQFYTLGSTNLDDQNLARTQYARAAGKASLTQVPLASGAAAVTVDGVGALAVSPLNAIATIQAMAVVPKGGGLSDADTVVVARTTEAGGTKAVVLVTKPTDGTAVSTAAPVVAKNAANVALDTCEPVAVAASKDDIFVAVPGTNVGGQEFGVRNAEGGIVRLRKAGDTLTGVALDGTLGADAKAYKINNGQLDNANAYVPSAESVQFGSGVAGALWTTAKGCCMHYDPFFKCLYVGLQGVNGPAGLANSIGALESLLVGKVIDDAAAADYKKMYVYPALDLKKASKEPLFVNNAKDGIIGFYSANNASLIHASIYHLGVMHTSTGKHYVIVNGYTGPAGQVFKERVYAVPVVNDLAHYNNAAAGIHGLVAKKDDSSAVVAGAVDMTLYGDPSRVGASYRHLVHSNDNGTLGNVEITDLHVVGDTVYVSLAGARAAIGGNNEIEAGVFSSTALFNAAGYIRAWTPWQRCDGNVQKVKGFGVDPQTSNIWYLEGENETLTGVTQWSKGDTSQQARDAGQSLQAKLAAIFPDGAYNLTAFDGETPGFKTENVPDTSYDYFAMMVATGDRKVSLIEAATGPGDKAFVPTGDFSVGNAVVTFDGTDAVAGAAAGKAAGLANLGRITCSEFTRNAAPAGNWLFVGGDGGVAVLCVTADGTGFGDAAAGAAAITALTADGLIAGSAFKQLSYTPALPAGSPDVLKASARKLVSDGTYLYVMTKDAVYRVEQVAAAFLGAAVPVANIATIATIAGSLAVAGAAGFAWTAGDEFYDMMVINITGNQRKFALATSKGVYISTNNVADAVVAGNEFLVGLGWTRNVDSTGLVDFPLGPALKFDFKSNVRGGKFTASKAEGNLYVTALDADERNLCVYRFNVSGGTVKAITEPYKDAAGNVTKYFYKIGAIDTADPGLEFAGGADMVAQAVLYPEQGAAGDFVDQVAMGPHPDKFLPNGAAGGVGTFVANSAIDLGVIVDNGFNMAAVCKDPASGAIYVSGTFSGGVRVNE